MTGTTRWTGRTRRSARGALAAGIALAAVTGHAVAASPSLAAGSTAPEDGAAAAASSWLAGQLVDGDHMETVFDGTGYPDHGLTADVILALTSTGSEDEAATAATGWLTDPDNVTAYVGSGAEQYAGAHAKLALTAIARGLDPTDLGDLDIIRGLKALETDEGRFSDASAWSDYSNVITQSFALIALERGTEDGASDASVDFLAGAQCDDGGFPSAFPTDGSCASEPDGTGFAVQALLATGADEAAADALDWLIRERAANGSWASDANGEPVPNANSTGVASQALTAAGEDTAASRSFLVSLQQQEGADAGALPYAAGDPVDARATAQAVPALAEISLLDVAVGAAPQPTPEPTPEPTPTGSAEPAPQPTVTEAPEPSPSTTQAAAVGSKNDLTNGGTELAATGATSPVLVAGATGLVLLGVALLLAARSSLPGLAGRRRSQP